jgi:hypothetical protein
MRSSAIAERFLAFIVGRTRASAIYGDLVELAVAHGRLWLCIAYVRTVVALTWRTPAALIAVLLSLRYFRRTTVKWFMLLSHPNVRDNVQFVHSGFGHYIFLVYRWLGWFGWLWNFRTLWLLLPYIVVRYGARSRLSYLAYALFLVGLPAYLFRPIPGVASQVAGVVIVAVALSYQHWRREMLFLAINSAVASAIYLITIVLPDPLHIFHHGHGPFPLGLFRMRIDEVIIVAVIFLLCPPLHRWLLESSEKSGVANIGDAYA